MADVAPMALRTLPIAGESLLGFLLRLAERSSVRDPIAFLSELGNPSTTLDALAFRPGDLARFAKRVGSPVAALEAMTYRPIGVGLISFQGTPLRREDVTVQQRRFCPKCLAERAYHRSIWDLSISHACVDHGLALSTHCWKCNRPATWAYGSVVQCACLADYRRTKAQPVGVSELAALKYVLGRLGHGVRQPGTGLLNDLEPRHAIELLIGLGAATIVGAKRRTIASLRAGNVHKVLQGGWRICADWPQGLFDAVDSCRSGGRYGLERQFGPLAAWMTEPTISPEVRAVLIDAMGRHPDLKYGASTRSKRVTVADDGALLTLKEAQQALRSSHPKVRDTLIRYGHVRRADLRGSGAPILVDARAVWRLEVQLSDLGGKTALRKALKCSRKGLEVLLNAGWLAVATGPAAELAGRPVWWLSEARAMLHTLREAVSERPKPRRFVRMARALSSSSCDGFDFRPANIEAIVARCAWDPSADGLEALLIDADLFARQRDSEAFTIPEAAIELGLKQEVAYYYCNRGFLLCREVAGVRGRRVMSADIAAFRHQFVVASHLGLDRGHYPGWASDQLIAKGYQAVSGPGIDGGRQFLFRRRDVERSGLVKATGDVPLSHK